MLLHCTRCGPRNWSTESKKKVTQFLENTRGVTVVTGDRTTRQEPSSNIGGQDLDLASGRKVEKVDVFLPSYARWSAAKAFAPKLCNESGLIKVGEHLECVSANGVYAVACSDFQEGFINMMVIERQANYVASQIAGTEEERKVTYTTVKATDS